MFHASDIEYALNLLIQEINNKFKMKITKPDDLEEEFE